MMFPQAWPCHAGPAADASAPPATAPLGSPHSQHAQHRAAHVRLAYSCLAGGHLPPTADYGGVDRPHNIISMVVLQLHGYEDCSYEEPQDQHPRCNRSQHTPCRYLMQNIPDRLS